MTQLIIVSRSAVDKALQDIQKYPNAPSPTNGVRIKLTRQEMRDAYKKALECVRQGTYV